MPGETIVSNVPIFPLNTVLFPRMPLTLRIFEERYKVMLRDLRASDNRFCVALIKEGSEVGETAEPHTVGCIAEVQQINPLPQGMFQLEVTGIERVRIRDLDRVSKPYLVGSLEFWPDGTPLADKELMKKASRLFEEYATCLLTLSGQGLESVAAPSDPQMLSYLLGTILEMEPPERQQLLQAPCAADRLRAEVAILRTKLPILQAIARSPKPPDIGGKFSAN